jgi:hypothetical protein
MRLVVLTDWHLTRWPAGALTNFRTPHFESAGLRPSRSDVGKSMRSDADPYWSGIQRDIQLDFGPMRGSSRGCVSGPDVRRGSWSCENALAEALMPRNLGEVAVLDHFAEFGGFSVRRCC